MTNTKSKPINTSMTFIAAGLTSDNKALAISDGLSEVREKTDNYEYKVINKNSKTRKYYRFDRYKTVVLLASEEIRDFENFCNYLDKKLCGAKTTKDLANFLSSEFKDWHGKGKRFELIIAGYHNRPEIYFYSTDNNKKDPSKQNRYIIGGYKDKAQKIFEKLYEKGLPNEVFLRATMITAISLTQEAYPEFVGGDVGIIEITKEGLVQ